MSTLDLEFYKLCFFRYIAQLYKTLFACLFLLVGINFISNTAMASSESYQVGAAAIEISSEKPRNGISYNRLTQFEANSSGVIIKNRGFRRAKTILIEVVGDAPSALLEKIAIDGKAAKIIITNSNGISCNGCKFVNTLGVELRTDSIDSVGEKISWVVDVNGVIDIDEKGISVEKSLVLSSGKIKLIGEVLAPEQFQVEAHSSVLADDQKDCVIDIYGSNAKIKAKKTSFIATGANANIRIAAEQLFSDKNGDTFALNTATQQYFYVESKQGSIINTSVLKDISADIKFVGNRLENEGIINGRNLELKLKEEIVNNGHIEIEDQFFSTSKAFINYQQIDVGGNFQAIAEYFIHGRGSISDDPAHIFAKTIAIYLDGEASDGYALAQIYDSILEAESGINIVSESGSLYFGYKKALINNSGNEQVEYAGSKLISANGKIHLQSANKVIFEGAQIDGDLLVEAKGEVLEMNPVIINNRQVFSHREERKRTGEFDELMVTLVFRCVEGCEYEYKDHYKKQSYVENILSKDGIVKDKSLNKEHANKVVLNSNFNGNKQIFANSADVKYNKPLLLDQFSVECLKFVLSSDRLDGVDSSLHEEL